MSLEQIGGFSRTSTPKFIEQAAQIHSHLKDKSPKFLSELMEISSSLADENWARNQKWKKNPSAKQSNAALFAFTGEVYRGIDAKSLDSSALAYLNKNYRILSGLYGLLKPSDRVMLYRLEMGRAFKFSTYETLYQFWRERLTEELNSELHSRDVVLNLASKEYFKALDKKALKSPVIDFEFYEIKSGKPKTIVVYTKHARGLMVRYCALNQVKTLDQVKAFNLEGYRFDSELSSETNFVYTR